MGTEYEVVIDAQIIVRISVAADSPEEAEEKARERFETKLYMTDIDLEAINNVEVYE